MVANTYYLQLMSILLNIFQPQRLILFLKKKRQEALEKKIGCKFIRINTSDAERGYDIDYEVSKIQIFISKFKEKKNKEKESKIKELDDKIKKIKTSINKSKCISCQKMFYQIKKHEKHTTKNKTDKNWEENRARIVQGVKTLLIILGHKM